VIPLGLWRGFWVGLHRFSFNTSALADIPNGSREPFYPRILTGGKWNSSKKPACCQQYILLRQADQREFFFDRLLPVSVLGEKGIS